VSYKDPVVGLTDDRLRSDGRGVVGMKHYLKHEDAQGSQKLNRKSKKNESKKNECIKASESKTKDAGSVSKKPSASSTTNNKTQRSAHDHQKLADELNIQRRPIPSRGTPPSRRGSAEKATYPDVPSRLMHLLVAGMLRLRQDDITNRCGDC
jgi:hypothetical protein